MQDHDKPNTGKDRGRRLSVNQVVELTGRSRRSIYRDMDTGTLPFIVADNGRRVIYETDAIRTYADLPAPVSGRGERIQSASRWLLSEREIYNASVRLPPKTGVYFLMRGKRVVYVGQSTNLYARLARHQEEKEFDRFAHIPCAPEELDALEALYIHLLKPELNGVRAGGSVVAPMAAEALFWRLTGAGS